MKHEHWVGNSLTKKQRRWQSGQILIAVRYVEMHWNSKCFLGRSTSAQKRCVNRMTGRLCCWTTDRAMQWYLRRLYYHELKIVLFMVTIARCTAAIRSYVFILLSVSVHLSFYVKDEVNSPFLSIYVCIHDGYSEKISAYCKGRFEINFRSGWNVENSLQPVWSLRFEFEIGIWAAEADTICHSMTTSVYSSSSSLQSAGRMLLRKLYSQTREQDRKSIEWLAISYPEVTLRPVEALYGKYIALCHYQPVTCTPCCGGLKSVHFYASFCFYCIWTVYGVDGSSSIFSRKRFYLLHKCANRLWGPRSLLSMGIGGSFLGGKPAGA
jgi:hypothetical protein